MKQNSKTGIYLGKLEKSQEYSKVNIIKNKHGKDVIMEHNLLKKTERKHGKSVTGAQLR